VSGPQHAVRVFVVTPRDLSGGQEELEVVHLLQGGIRAIAIASALLLFGQSSLFVALQFLHPLLAMGAESQLFLVAPQDGIVRGAVHLAAAAAGGNVHGLLGPFHDLVEIWHLVFAMVTYEEEEGALLGGVGVLEEGADAFV